MNKEIEDLRREITLLKNEISALRWEITFLKQTHHQPYYPTPWGPHTPKWPDFICHKGVGEAF